MHMFIMSFLLKLYSLFAALEMSAMLAAEFAGINVPTFFEPAYGFGGFVAGFLLLLVCSDYGRGKPTYAMESAGNFHAPVRKASHALAA